MHDIFIGNVYQFLNVYQLIPDLKPRKILPEVLSDHAMNKKNVRFSSRGIPRQIDQKKISK